MATHNKPGPKKGVPRPLKRQIDGGFPDRFIAACAMRPDLDDDVKIAKTLGCTKQVVGQWKFGGRKAIDALLVLKIMDVFGVSGRWLLTGKGSMAAPKSLDPDEEKLLNIWRLMIDADMREFWLGQGKKLLAAQPPPKATAGWPYKPELTEKRAKLRAPANQEFKQERQASGDESRTMKGKS
jgi:transcriptional regulator with XRE-family HTH domain